MLLLTAGQKLLFVNDNIEMESWSELLTIDDKRHFEQNDHFNILCSDAYQFINSYLQRTVPSQSLENVQFMKPLDFVIIQKQHHLARAAQQFKKLKIMNKGAIIHDGFLEPTQSTTSISTDREFEICYHHLRFHKLEISDVSKKDAPMPVFTVIKQFINSADVTQPLVHAIHGISGSGKSMVCEQIELDFLNDYINQTSLWLPIRLPAETFHAANLIKLSQTLQVNLKSLIAHNDAKLLFIIDNYDEACIEFINDVLTYNQSSKIKFLITGTHDLLNSKFKSLYNLSCYNLTFPSAAAIEDCCKMHQKYHDPTYRNVYGELEEILNNNPIMRQLLNTPRNIRQLLPYINLISIYGLNDEFSMYNLSMKLFTSNIEFHSKQRGVRIRTGLDLKKTSLQYAKELSFTIATKDTDIAQYNHNDADTQALKELCRVSFSKYSASFEAPLFYYLQLANYLLDALNHDENDAFLTLLHIDLAPLTLSLDFMAEFIRANSTHNSTITSNLLGILFNKNTGKPTSNAMSILGRCYHNFGGLYFANLKFNTANFDGVILDGSYMKDCSLANVDISRTSIRHCQFNNTTLRDSTVNSYQIETETAPKLIMLSHNGKYLAYLMHYHKYMTLKIINLDEGNCIFDEKILQTDFLDKASCLFTTDDDHFLLILHNQIITFDLQDVKNIKRLNTTTDNNSDLIAIFSSIQNDNSLIIGKSYEDGSLELSLRTTNPGEKSLFENSITQTSVNQQLSELLSKDEVMINPCRMLGLNGWIFTPGAFTLLPIVEENVVKFWTNIFQNREVSAMTSKNQYCLIATIINSTSVSIQQFPGNDTVYCETTKAYHGIYQLQFAFDATILIGTTHSSLLVWDVETGALLENFPTHHNEVMNFTVAENAQLLAYTVYECANKINIFKVTQYNQPKQQEKFIAIADDGRYSLWQISSQRYQLRVNGGRTVVPIELNYHTAPITHKLKPFIAYKIGSELIVKRFDRKNSCTYQITTSLMPLYFIDDKFLALAEFLHPKQLTAIFDLTTQSIISPQTTIPIIPRYELAKNQLICYETPQTDIKWKADLQSHYPPHSMVVSADEELIAISFPNGRIHIYSGHDGKFLDELVITYLSFDYLKNLYIHITQQHDIIVTDDDNHQWYWRNKKMIWSATPATTHTATGALLDHQSTHNPSLNQRLTFFGAQHSNQPLTTLPSQNELLLVILQRFYGVGIHANIKNIQYARDESNLTITVDDVYEDRVIYLPKTVANAAIPHLDLETIGIANNNKQ